VTRSTHPKSSSVAKKNPKTVETLKHDEAKRKNIPTAEHQSVLQKNEQNPVRVAFERGVAGLQQEKQRRSRDLDPQLVWRGKDEQDWSDLVVHAPPLYIQEKVHPKALIDDLLRETREREYEGGQSTLDLFADFNGMPTGVDKTEFYQHDQNWSNRMILGDSLQVMASLAEREGLRGKVQCIYFDPPYGIKFNSNFQWSTTNRDVKDGNAAHITREPEQVKAFRDTWRDGIHSYLTYLRDRLTVARDLLADSGSIFVQIGDENVHRVRAVMDEVFGDENFCALIPFVTTSSQTSQLLSSTHDFLIWFARNRSSVKFRRAYKLKEVGEEGGLKYNSVELQSGERGPTSRLVTSDVLPMGARVFRPSPMVSQSGGETSAFPVMFDGQERFPRSGFWKTNREGIDRLIKSNRIVIEGRSIAYVRYLDDFPVFPISSFWEDTWGVQSRSDPKRYVVQTSSQVIERCLLMTTDPGDLVLDPTCGSGTTATVAEQWGRRWITIDTSRVALTLARARIMGARYSYYLLADSKEGQNREAEVRHSMPSSAPTSGDIRQGFVYERVPHITLKSIANNAEIDVIWDKRQATLEPIREKLNAALGRGAPSPQPSPQPSPTRGEGVKAWEEWEIPREADAKWPDAAKKLHADWWQARIARQKEIDASIAAKAEFEYLYDKPYIDNKKVRVAGPFTVESLSPHRVLGVDENDELIDPAEHRTGEPGAEYAAKQSFPQMILENLKAAGVQQAHKEDRIVFTSLTPWPGELICAEGRYIETSPSPQPSPQGGEGANSEASPKRGEGANLEPSPRGGGRGQGEGVGVEKRAGIFIGPEFGTVTRPDLVAAAREAGDADFDVLIACAFNYEAHATEFNKLGRIPVLKARMNADLHMAEDLKATGKGNLFVIFGEPDIDILSAEDGKIRVKVNGVDVFHPQTGEVRSDGPDGIACWFIDTDYNEESFFVRHAYFLGANDPYNALKTTLKAEINEEAWATLNSDTSRAFPKPKSGRIAVKVINHLGDEVMKVFRT
jgi:adenine-specific DNA-methyltransferase